MDKINTNFHFFQLEFKNETFIQINDAYVEYLIEHKYKEIIDKEIEDLITLAYQRTRLLLLNSDSLLKECAELLVIEHELDGFG